MEFELLGWPPDGPTLDLDWRRFSYAGKFVMSATGKAVAMADGEVVAALAFNEDRTDEDTLWFRYVTVRDDRRGNGIGPDLLRFGLARAEERGYGRVKIAVNNPFAYEAGYRAGFGYTGETTGLAELVLAWPRAGTTDRYQAGFDCFRNRDLTDAERSFLADRRDAEPPEPIPVDQ